MSKKMISIILNSLVFLLALMGVIFMVCGIQFMKQQLVLESEGLENFKYFTVDSNIFVGLTSLVYLIYVFGKKEVPQWLHILKYMSCVSILLTFFVTACFLAPASKEFPFVAFYQNSNLFFHLIVPILSGISFLFFEERKLSFKTTFLGMVPVAVYAIFYMIPVFQHIENHTVSYHYDFYGFLRAGVMSAFYVVPIVFLATYVISFILWFASCRKQ